MQFIKTLRKRYYNPEFDISFEKCHRYQIFENQVECGNFYYKAEYAFGSIGETDVVIFPDTKFGFNRSFIIKNANNDAVVGKISLSLWKGMSPASYATVDLIHKSTYNWGVQCWDYSWLIFPPRTRSKFWAMLENDNEKFEIYWEYKGQDTGYSINEFPVQGEVSLTDSCNHYLLLTGLYLTELRMAYSITD